MDKKTFEDLTSDEKIIETARLRTNGFTKAVDSYYRDAFEFPRENFEGTDLPGWNNINGGSLNFINNIKAFTDFLDPRPDQDAERMRIMTAEGGRRKFLEETSVFPNEKFPYVKGYGNDMTLYELLRRRPDSAVSAWEQRMQAVGKELEDGTVIDGKTVNEQDWAELWNWAAIAANDMVHQQPDGSDEEDDEEEDVLEEDQEMTDVKGKGVGASRLPEPMPLAYVLSYVSNGYIPPDQPKDGPTSR